MTSSLAVFEAAMSKINASDKIMFGNQNKKRKYENKTYFYLNLHLKDRLDIKLTACISLVCGSGIVIEVRKKVTHRISNTSEQYCSA